MIGSRIAEILAILIGGSEQFRRNFLGMAGANVLAQAVALLALPVLTRAYSPSDFGVLAIFAMTHGLLLAVATGRFDWLVPNVRKASEAALLVCLGLLATCLISIIVAITLYFFIEVIGLRLLIEPSNRWLLWFLPCAVLAGGVQLSLWAWHVFIGDMRVFGISRIGQSLVTTAVSIVCGIFSLGAFGLILGYTIGIVLSCPMLLRGQRLLINAALLQTPCRLRQGLRLYRSQAGTSLAISVVNNAVTVSMPFFLSQTYSLTVVGWYGLVMRVATAPIGLITGAISHSFWSDAAKLVQTDPVALRRFYLQSIFRLSIIAMPIILICLAGPWFIGSLFGQEQWGGAGVLLAAVTPYLFAIIVVGPTTHLIVFGRLMWQFWSDLGMLVGSGFAVFIAAALGAEPWLAVLLGSSAVLLGYVARFALHLAASSRAIAAFGAGRQNL